jgi:mRNA deadenylase 3'-5' endonuclease subunit Ccr4
VAGIGADLCCLQEVEDETFTFLERQLGAVGYEGRLTKKGRGRPDGCATFLRRRRADLRECTRLEYHEQPEGRSSGHVAQILLLVIENRMLGVANTHLTWDPPETLPEAAYATRQVQELLAHLSEGRYRSISCLVCGDFNCTPDSAAVHMMGGAGFSQTHAPSAGATYGANGQAKMIDYIFYRGALRPEPLPVVGVRDETVLPNASQPSDHVPVVARFEWVD